MAREEQETTYWAGITRLDKGSCPQPSSLQAGLALHMPDHSVYFPCPGPSHAVPHSWLLFCPYPQWS